MTDLADLLTTHNPPPPPIEVDVAERVRELCMRLEVWRGVHRSYAMWEPEACRCAECLGSRYE